MLLTGKPLNDWTEADLRSLIGREAEAKILDFKRELPGNKDDDKKEFLADVSSFANASGGYLIFGMDEEKGIASGLPGISDIDPDAEILRLENMPRDGVKPRVPGISTQRITLSNGNFVLVMHIPKSWASPHMVTFKNGSRFFSRTSNGKYQLDVNEIRAAFLLSESLGEKIRNFRVDRISQIQAGETPVPIRGGEKNIRIVLHSIPFGAFEAHSGLEMKNVDELCRQAFRPMFLAIPTLYNFDGLVGNFEKGGLFGYVQLFRNGIVEVVRAYDPQLEVLRFENYESDITRLFGCVLELQKSLGLEPPIAIFLSLLNMLNRGIESIHNPTADGPLVDRNILLSSDILLEAYPASEELSEVLKPAFDTFANAAGWPESPNQWES